jgi:hypothetical protein
MVFSEKCQKKVKLFTSILNKATENTERLIIITFGVI